MSETKSGLADKAKNALVQFLAEKMSAIVAGLNEVNSKYRDTHVVYVQFESRHGSPVIKMLTFGFPQLSKQKPDNIKNQKRMVTEILNSGDQALWSHVVILCEFISIEEDQRAQTFGMHWMFVPYYVVHGLPKDKADGKGMSDEGGDKKAADVLLADKETYSSQFWTKWNRLVKADGEGSEQFTTFYQKLMACTKKLGSWFAQDPSGSKLWTVQGSKYEDATITRHVRAFNAEMAFATLKNPWPDHTSMAFVLFEKLPEVEAVLDHDPVDKSTGQVLYDSEDTNDPTPYQKNRREVVEAHYALCSSKWRAADTTSGDGKASSPSFRTSNEFKALPPVSELFVEWRRHGLLTAVLATYVESGKSTLHIAMSAGSCTHLEVKDLDSHPLQRMLKLVEEYAADSGCTTIVVHLPSFGSKSPAAVGWVDWASLAFLKLSGFKSTSSDTDKTIWATKTIRSR